MNSRRARSILPVRVIVFWLAIVVTRQFVVIGSMLFNIFLSALDIDIPEAPGAVAIAALSAEQAVVDITAAMAGDAVF